MGDSIEYPREPVFYPNKPEPVIPGNYDTLQSIDGTLKRIEKLLIQMRSQSAASDGLVLSEQT